MAKAASTGKVTRAAIRMYRCGTGDFFLVQFKRANKVTFNLMIDCGCIKGGKVTFEDKITDMKTLSGGVVDLLVVTHEHADHINGFEKCADLFDKITFKKVWFAWTEDDKDPTANDYRKHYSELDKAVKKANTKLTGLLKDGYFNKLYKDESGSSLMVAGKKKFIDSLASITSLSAANGLAATDKKGKVKPTMRKLLENYKVIKKTTEVEFLEPGDVRRNLAGATGISFYVLGPPRERKYLDETEKAGESYEKREKKSNIDFALVMALNDMDVTGDAAALPFEARHEVSNKPTTAEKNIMGRYKDGGEWKQIENDWLFSAGALAMRYEKSINNTSLALAIQFDDSEKVLLFPGDAELGNWKSWHDKLKWDVKIKGTTEKKTAKYFLNNTVFYKVGQHLSQNGTAKTLGLELMTSDELTAMATLDFKKINDGWLNTMPNDLIGAELISKTKGKLYFVGDADKILKNIKTKRVTVKKKDEDMLRKLNKPFDGKGFIECEIEG